LRLLSSFDWTFSPMVIDINNDFNLKDEKEINVSSLSSFHLFNQSPSP
jgi:U3 small nucleolar RNA-associated protein 22